MTTIAAAEFSARTTVPETIGVHAALPWCAPGTPRTACGLTLYQSTWYVDPDTDITCYRCRTNSG